MSLFNTAKVILALLFLPLFFLKFQLIACRKYIFHGRLFYAIYILATSTDLFHGYLRQVNFNCTKNLCFFAFLQVQIV